MLDKFFIIWAIDLDDIDVINVGRHVTSELIYSWDVPTLGLDGVEE